MTLEDEGLMERPREEVGEEPEKQDQIKPFETPREEEKSPGKLYNENGVRVAYTPQGRRVALDGSMPEAELLYFGQYPEVMRAIYGETPKVEETEPQIKNQGMGLVNHEKTELISKHNFLISLANEKTREDNFPEVQDLGDQDLGDYISGRQREADSSLTTRYYKCRRGEVCDATFEKQLPARESARFCSRCGNEDPIELSEGGYRADLEQRAKRMSKIMSKLEPTLRGTLEEKANGVVNVAHILASDLKTYVARTAKTVGKGALKVACKASYPIMGNLSANLQTRLENLVGKDNYDAQTARNVSFGTNFILYGLTAGLGVGKLVYDEVITANVTNNTTDSPMTIAIVIGIWGGTFSGVYNLFEGFMRSFEAEKSKVTSASLPGKIISYPIEGVIKLGELTGKAYKGIRNYFHNVGERARTRGNGK